MNQANVGAGRSIGGRELSGSLRQSGREVLRYAIIYPCIEAKTPAERQLNHLHLGRAKAFEHTIKARYLPGAHAQFKALEAGGGFEPLEINASFQVMLNTGRLLSFFTDTFYQLRHQGTRLARSSRTYDMAAGETLGLPQLFAGRGSYRQALFDSIYSQIAREDQNSPGCYFSDWPARYREALEPGGFYLSDDGVVVYYQENTIAGKNAGLPSFLTPYPIFAGQLRFGLQ